MMTIYAALATAFILILGIMLGIALGGALNERLPGHPTDLANILLPVIPAFGGVFAGGGAWGWTMSRITRAGERKRMAWAGALGFAPTLILVALALTLLENLIVEQSKGPPLPIHNVFTLLFVPAAAIIAGVGGLALGIGAQNRVLARRLLWQCALVGGSAFLVVNLGLDALGFRVGAPGAAERATMLTTAFLGNFVAALASGGVIGAILGRK
jgi:hypothetical protein